MRFPFDTTIERGDDEIEIRVIYDVSPHVAATYWQPAEGGEVELISVRRGGEEFQLTDAEEAKLIAECEARSGDDISDEAAAAADWQYQEYRDRQPMDGR